MIRTTSLFSITIQFPNPVIPMAFGVPAYMTNVQSLQNGDQQVGHPTQTQTPLVPSDITPELLAAINTQLASLGLVASKIDA